MLASKDRNMHILCFVVIDPTLVKSCEISITVMNINDACELSNLYAHNYIPSPNFVAVLLKYNNQLIGNLRGQYNASFHTTTV